MCYYKNDKEHCSLKKIKFNFIYINITLTKKHSNILFTFILFWLFLFIYLFIIQQVEMTLYVVLKLLFIHFIQKKNLHI